VKQKQKDPTVRNTMLVEAWLDKMMYYL